MSLPPLTVCLFPARPCSARVTDEVKVPVSSFGFTSALCSFPNPNAPVAIGGRHFPTCGTRNVTGNSVHLFPSKTNHREVYELEEQERLSYVKKGERRGERRGEGDWIACPPTWFVHALTALIKTYGEGKLGQPTASVNAEQTASLNFMCDLEFKNADFVLVDGFVKENTLIAWGGGKKWRII